MKPTVRKCHNPLCGKEFETTAPKRKFCSDKCRHEYNMNIRFPDGSDYVVCQECGMKAKQISQHICKVHNMSINDYCDKYNCSVSDLTCKSLHDSLSTNIKKACADGRCGWQVGGDNPSKSEYVKSGRRSIFSMNYHGYDGLSDDEKRKKIELAANEVARVREENGNNTTSIEYYLKRGFSKSEARKMLKDRQRTFTLEKCKEKYGDVEGERIYNDRQERWQNTLNSKSDEEKERIYRAKMFVGKGYSKISQQMFNEIMDVIGDEFSNVFYATNNPNKKFNEYFVNDYVNNRIYFLDFYVKDNNKVIEFDGDYWHGEKRGNQERDAVRETNLRNLGFVNIKRVRERDYREHPEQIVSECVEFIRRRN